MKLIFATNNLNKLAEIQKIVPKDIEIISLKQAGINVELPEPYFTFKENAYSKAKFVFDKLGLNCFAEDSGIIAEALINEPGVLSARYAGEPCDDTVNNNKLLERLNNQTDRTAHYQATICLLWNGEIQYFEGKCKGSIALQPIGENGFGYDPLFIPEGYKYTFAELSIDIKLKLSHRTKAFNLLTQFLNERQNDK